MKYASLPTECLKTFLNPPNLHLQSFIRALLYRHLPPSEAKPSGENRRSSAPRPKNATSYAEILESRAIEEELRAHEERRFRRETPGRQAEYDEANRRKYLRVPKETRNGGRRAERSVSVPHTTPAPSTTEPVCGPTVVMTAIHRPRAIWLLEARAACARFKEERASADNGHTSEHFEVKRK